MRTRRYKPKKKKKNCTVFPGIISCVGDEFYLFILAKFFFLIITKMLKKSKNTNKKKKVA